MAEVLSQDEIDQLLTPVFRAINNPVQVAGY
jgi:flagellar motor switch protein FliM